MASSWYERNKHTVIARSSKKRAETRAWFKEYKKTLSCIQCGQNHPATLDFHHVVRRPDNRKLRTLVATGTKNSILEELQKCVVLCSNCHRIHHWNERLDRHPDMPTIHIPTTYSGLKTMFQKLKSLFKGKETKAEESKEKANTTPQQYARAERTEPKPAVKPAKPVAKAPAKPAPRKPATPAKKPAAQKFPQKRGK